MTPLQHNVVEKKETKQLENDLFNAGNYIFIFSIVDAVPIPQFLRWILPQLL